MKKRILSLLLCLVLCLSLLPMNTFAATEYDIWVGGVQVTDTNKDDVLRDGKVRYVPASGTEDATLYLTNATVTGNAEGNANEICGIRSYEALNIVCSGTNNIESSSEDRFSAVGIMCSSAFSTVIPSEPLSVSGDGTLNVRSFGDGIFCSTLSVDGLKELNVRSYDRSAFIVKELDITATKVTAAAKCDDSPSVHDEVPLYIYLAGKQDDLKPSCRIHSGSLELHCIDDRSSDHSMCSTDENILPIASIPSDYYVTGGENEGEYRYLDAPHNISGTESPVSLPAHSSYVDAEGYVHYINHIYISDREPDAVNEDWYPTMVGGIRVTDANKHDVFGDGKVRYVPAADTEAAALFLNNAVISGVTDSNEMAACGITADESLNIIASGSNIITGVSDGRGISATHLTVSGGGSLTVTANNDAVVCGRLTVENLSELNVTSIDYSGLDVKELSIASANVSSTALGSVAGYCPLGQGIRSCVIRSGSLALHCKYNYFAEKSYTIDIPENYYMTGGSSAEDRYDLTDRSGDLRGRLKYSDAFGTELYANHLYISDREPITYYPVYVGGVQATNEISGDVFGDGTVSYTPASDGSHAVLTLNNADIAGVHGDGAEMKAGIYTGEDLRIEINGVCSVSSASDADAVGISVSPGHDLIVQETKSSSLKVKGNAGSIILDAGSDVVPIGELAIVGGKTDADEYPLTFDGGQYTYGSGKAASFVHIMKRVHMDAPQNLLLVSEQASWSAVENASYEFTLYKVGSTGGEPVMTLTTDETEIDLRKVYPDLACGESYYYTVKAFRSFYEYSAVMKSKTAYIPYPTLTGEATFYPADFKAGSTVTVNAPLSVAAKLLHYRWQISADGAGWTDIAGETASSYTIRNADEGKYIRVIITADGYHRQQTSSAKYITPSVTGTVVINGTPRYGSTLKAFVNGSQDTVFLYSWSIDGGSFGAASSSGEHTITVGDIGHTLRCMATAYGNVTGSLISEEVLIGKQPGPAAPSVVGHPATEADDSNGWIENGRDVRVEYSTDSEFKTGVAIATGNIYDLRSGTYYVRTPATDWRDASEAAKVTVGSHTDALAIKPIDTIPFGRSNNWTDNIYVEAQGGTAPYTWTILNQPIFIDPIENRSYTYEAELHSTAGGSASAYFMVQFPESSGSNYGRMRIRVTDSKGDIAEMPIFFEGYKGTQPDYRYFFTLERNTARQDFSKKTYTYGYDPIPESEYMIVTLQNTCSDNNYAIKLSDLTFDLSDNNGNEFFDCYIDPAFNGTELQRYEEVDIYIVPKTGLDASNGWPYGYPVTLRVSHPEKTTPVSLSGSVYFKVEPKALSGCTVEPVSPQLWTGSPVTPELKIWDGKRYLTEEDFYAEWSDNTGVGTAGYTVRAKVFSYYDIPEAGTGNYTGELGGTFTITSLPAVNETLFAYVDTGSITGKDIDLSYLFDSLGSISGTPTVTVQDGGNVLSSYSFDKENFILSIVPAGATDAQLMAKVQIACQTNGCEDVKIEVRIITQSFEGHTGLLDGPEAPTGLIGVACTTPENNNGKITGVSAEMEYSSADSFASATSCTGNEITGLTAGTYYVRIRENMNHRAGGAATVTVPAYTPCTVTFDANGHGTAPAAQTVASGSKAEKPSDLTEAGWTFGGWYQETACTNAYDFETPVTADITVYAKWTKKPSVLFGDANGDGTVDSKDLSLLRKYMAAYDYTTGTSTVTVQPGADANGDGTIDSKDLSLLRKYMASYDYTTGTSTVVLGPSK